MGAAGAAGAAGGVRATGDPGAVASDAEVCGRDSAESSTERAAASDGRKVTPTAVAADAFTASDACAAACAAAHEE